MLKPIQTYSIILFSSLLSGCGASLFSHRDTNPNIQDIAVAPHFWPWSKNGVNTFSTTASRRMVLVSTTNWGKEMTSCAEPSPDVGEAFASAISDALKLAATDPKSGINGSLSNDYARAVATQITPLVYRTQSLQLYRDAIHNHCIDRMNGWYPKNDNQLKPVPVKVIIERISQAKDNLSQYVTPVEVNVDVNDYNAMKLYFFEKTVEALKTEVPAALEAQKVFFQNQKTTGVPLDTVKELASAIKTASPTTVTSTASGTTIVSSPNPPAVNK